MGNPRRFPRNKSKTVPDRKKKSASKSSDSTVKSTRRSTSASSSEASSSHVSRRVIKTVEPEPDREGDDGWARALVSWLQMIFMWFVVAAFIYHLFWGDKRRIMMEYVMLEAIALLLATHALRTNYIGYCCIFLGYQYMLTFFFFSSFLQYELPDGSLVEKLASPASVSFFAVFSHFILMFHSMELIKYSQKRADYYEKIIVESSHKRRLGLYRLISEIGTQFAFNQDDVKINLKLADETGRPMKLSGAAVETSVNRTTELRHGVGSVEVSSSNSAEATIRVPPASKKCAPTLPAPIPVQQSQQLNSSVYNNVTKQTKMLCPRKLL